MANTQDNVLNGNSPLTRSSMSGGILSEIYRKPKDRLEAWRFGSKVRLYTFGTRREPIEMVFDKYFLPIGRLETSFNKFFDFYKKARKEDLKAQGRTGIRGMFKEFMDFRVWKKIFGIARDPTVAALHQIRDLLIDVHDPSGSKKYKARFGLDPQETMMGIMNALPVFLKRYKKEGEENTSIFRAIKGFFKEVKGDQEALKKAQWQNLILNKRKVDLDEKEAKKADKNLKTQKEISKINKSNNKLQKNMAHSLSATAKLTKESLETAEFNRITDEKKEIRQTKDKGLLGGLLGTTGAIVGSVLGGLGSLLTGGGIGGGILKGGLVGGLLTGKVGSVIGKVGIRGLGVGIGTGLMAKDFLTEGLPEFREGNIGQGIVKTLFGDIDLEKEPGENIKTTVKNAIKYGSYGLAVAGPKGFLVGAALGLGGTGVMALIKMFKKMSKAEEDMILADELKKEFPDININPRELRSKIFKGSLSQNLAAEGISGSELNASVRLMKGGSGTIGSLLFGLGVETAFDPFLQKITKDSIVTAGEIQSLEKTLKETYDYLLTRPEIQEQLTDPKKLKETGRGLLHSELEEILTETLLRSFQIASGEAGNVIIDKEGLERLSNVLNANMKELSLYVSDTEEQQKKVREKIAKSSEETAENTRFLKTKIFGNIYYTTSSGERIQVWRESKAEQGT